MALFDTSSLHEVLWFDKPLPNVILWTIIVPCDLETVLRSYFSREAGSGNETMENTLCGTAII